MPHLIVITGIDQLPAEDRWPRFVAPLADALASSGLGTVWNLDMLRREFDQCGQLAITEVAVNLKHMDYGRELVDRVTDSAGIRLGVPIVPARWREFHCEDYFSSPVAERGHFDIESQTPVVVSHREVVEDTDIEFLVVGTSGADGINFGYRKGHTGLWAYFPICGNFKSMAPTIVELIDGWCSGRLNV